MLGCTQNKSVNVSSHQETITAETNDEPQFVPCDNFIQISSVSNNHPEGVKGAQAIASSVFLCKEGKSKQEIKEYIEKTFDYNLNRTITEVRPRYEFDVSCQGSVPEAIIAFMEGNSFEEVIRLAISLGGDSDTIGAMAGAIAACMYPIPDEIAEKCNNILTEDLREIKDQFMELLQERGNK